MDIFSRTQRCWKYKKKIKLNVKFSICLYENTTKSNEQYRDIILSSHRSCVFIKDDPKELRDKFKRIFLVSWFFESNFGWYESQFFFDNSRWLFLSVQRINRNLESISMCEIDIFFLKKWLSSRGGDDKYFGQLD